MKTNDKIYIQEISSIDSMNLIEDEPTCYCDRCGDYYHDFNMIDNFCKDCHEKSIERSSQDIYDSLSFDEQRDWDRRASGGWQ